MALPVVLPYLFLNLRKVHLSSWTSFDMGWMIYIHRLLSKYNSRQWQNRRRWTQSGSPQYCVPSEVQFNLYLHWLRSTSIHMHTRSIELRRWINQVRKVAYSFTSAKQSKDVFTLGCCARRKVRMCCTHTSEVGTHVRWQNHDRDQIQDSWWFFWVNPSFNDQTLSIGDRN